MKAENGMGSVYKVGDKWRAVISLGGKRRKTRVRSSEPEARKALREMRRQRDAGVFDWRTTSQTLAGYLEEWRTVHRKPHVRPHTCECYRSRLHQVARHIGTVALTDVSPVDVSRARAALLDEGYAPATVKACLATFKTAMEDAVSMGLIPTNPAAKLKAPTVPKTAKAVLTQADMLRLLDHARGSEEYALWAVFCGLGLRKGEVCALRWSDIEGNVMHIRHTATTGDGRRGCWLGPVKTAASRRDLVMPDEVVAALEGHRFIVRRRRDATEGWQESDLIFPGKWGGIMSPKTVNDKLERYLDALGLPRLTAHLLRHSHVTFSRLMGIEQEVLRDRLGHASITVTSDIYTHVQPSQHEEAAGRMNRFLRGESG